jgi:hypothetical protein
MPSEERVQDTHISKQLRVLHGALLSIVSVMNRPERDEVLIRQAGIRLDRAARLTQWLCTSALATAVFSLILPASLQPG